MMSKDMEQGYAGPLFEDFLKEQGVFEETTERAVRRVLAFELSEAMRSQNLSRSDVAERMQTSLSQLDELLDLEKDGVTLTTLARAAEVVGRRLKIELQ